VLTFVQVIITFLWLKKEDRKAWWEETIKFTSEIIPLLLVGVFFAGFLTRLIPEDAFVSFAGRNTVLANFAGVLFGAIAYFPALVEVPIAESFMKLGAHPGPLLSYLLSDPVLSLQGILIINKFLGWKKTTVYVVLVTVLTMLAGLIYGVFI